MIHHFDRDGTDLKVYQITANMPNRHCPSEPPMSRPMEIATETAEGTEPANIPIAAGRIWTGLFVSSEKHKIEPTCVYLLDGAMQTVQRITTPRQPSRPPCIACSSSDASRWRRIWRRFSRDGAVP